MSINKVIMVGNMTRDPELRRTMNGTPVTSFTIALNRITQSNEGQQADFINCVCWNKLAENVSNYCFKGSKVGVVGHLQSRSYQNNSGQNVYVTEVVCEQVEFLNTKNSQENQNTNTYQQQDNDPFNATFDIMDDDLQF